MGKMKKMNIQAKDESEEWIKELGRKKMKLERGAYSTGGKRSIGKAEVWQW